ncbi:MAG: hypothetical protein U5L45_07605 [Saprospiraceae bacterium]|nr:hypothetical protein [Saprospiraceae bacterium]
MLASLAKRGESGSFSGKARKTPPLLLLRAKRAKVCSSFLKNINHVNR